jgi:UDP-N-acetylmuramoyl-tripeptide--D-alanyl-D-alanine ligase
MDKIKLSFILKSTGGVLIKGDEDFTVNKVSTDSRKVDGDSLFFPLIGVNHDAHKFLKQVYDNGCKTIAVSDEAWIKEMSIYNDINIIKVDDTLYAMQELAKEYLNTLNVKKISITGSVGKTTTKDLLFSILNSKYKAGRNIGNLNNDIGVPLTIFSFDSSLDAVIIEMGMGYDGHIERLAEIVKPDVAIITTIGSSHIEIHKTREGILKEKLKITDYFDSANTLVVNETCDLLKSQSMDELINGRFKVCTVGNDNSDFSVKNICDLGALGIEFTLVHLDKEYRIKLPIIGAHNALNASLAIAGAYELGVNVDQAILGLSQLDMTKNRLEIKAKGKFTIIDDTYNASKESMCAALDTLKNIKGKRKIAILGDMYELGEDTSRSHEIVGEYAAETQIDILIAIGENAVDTAEAARQKGGIGRVYYFKEKEEVYSLLSDILKKGDTILVKASRGMALEKVVEQIEKIS